MKTKTAEENRKLFLLGGVFLFAVAIFFMGVVSGNRNLTTEMEAAVNALCAIIGLCGVNLIHQSQNYEHLLEYHKGALE